MFVEVVLVQIHLTPLEVVLVQNVSEVVIVNQLLVHHLHLANILICCVNVVQDFLELILIVLQIVAVLVQFNWRLLLPHLFLLCPHNCI